MTDSRGPRPQNVDLDQTHQLDIAEPDITVPLSDRPQWAPGPKLSARVEPRRSISRPEPRRDPRLLAIVILIAAIAIAIALWITALWLRTTDDAPEQTGELVTTLHGVSGRTAGSPSTVAIDSDA